MDFIEGLWDDWKPFLRIVLHPLGLCFLLFTFLLGAALVSIDQDNKVVIATFTSLVSLSSGILGGIWAKRWDDLTEEKVLVARGKTAIRGLTLLLNRTSALELRVQEYLNRHNDEKCRENISAEVVKTYLEEVIQRCRILQDEALSSIDNWKDAIPEANVGIQVGVVSELRLEQAGLIEDAERLGAELEETKERSEEEVKSLRERLRETVGQLSEARSKLSRVDPLGVGSIAITSGSALSGDIGPYPWEATGRPRAFTLGEPFNLQQAEERARQFSEMLGTTETLPRISARRAFAQAIQDTQEEEEEEEDNEVEALSEDATE